MKQCFTLVLNFYKNIKILQNSSKAFISNIITLMQSEYYPYRKYIYNCDEVPEKSKFISDILYSLFHNARINSDKNRRRYKLFDS